MSSNRIATLVIALAFCGGPASALAPAQESEGLLGGIASQTLGGAFLWSDEVVFRDWRIQRSAMVGWYRLIDPRNRRHARGTFEDCLTKLEQIKVEKNLAPLPDEVVVALHGLGAGRQYMNGLSDYLEEKGMTVVNVGYPSTLADINQHAKSLDSVVRHLDGAKRVSFVAHSMGNIVVRRFLYDVNRLAPEMQPQVEFKRMVMIAPPNHGAQAADALGGQRIVQLVGGDAVEQLAPNGGWPELEKRLATPDFEFGVIAGGTGDDVGYARSLIDGDDDGLLSVETTKLAGAADFLQTGGLHQLMAQYTEVRVATLNFLRHGFFISETERQPLAAAVADSP